MVCSFLCVIPEHLVPLVVTVRKILNPVLFAPGLSVGVSALGAYIRYYAKAFAG